jgi:hypothetical protein
MPDRWPYQADFVSPGSLCSEDRFLDVAQLILAEETLPCRQRTSASRDGAAFDGICRQVDQALFDVILLRRAISRSISILKT